MSEKRHPLVQNMIDICERAINENNPIDKSIEDIDMSVDNTMQKFIVNDKELIDFLKMCGMSEEDIKKILD